MKGIFSNTKKSLSIQDRVDKLDIFSAAKVAGLIALAVTFVYWGFVRSDSHVWLSRVLLGSAIAFNLFFMVIYRREMKLRGLRKG